MASFEKAVLPPKDFRIILILCICSTIFIIPAFWLFTNKKHNEWLEQTKKQNFSGIIINKKINHIKRQYLVTLKIDFDVTHDTCIDSRPWEKLFDECQINDTLIKKANSFNIIIKRNNETQIFALAPEYL